MEDNYIPDWFDAILRIRYNSDVLIEELQKDGIENVTIDDIMIAIDRKLTDLYGHRSSREFVVFDSDGEEW